MNFTSLSIAICTYNRCNYLVECLESIYIQNSQDAELEVLVIDNNSTDNTKSLVLDFIQKHNLQPNFRYILEVNAGLSVARNRAIEEAKHPLISFVDDDAILEQNFVQEVLESFNNNPALSVVGGKVIPKFEDIQPQWRNPYTESAFFSQHTPSEKPFFYEKGKYPVGCNMSFNKSDLINASGFDSKLGRKGDSATGAEEKELINKLNSGQNVFFNPKLVVHHQISKERTEQNSLDKISIGIGKTNKIVCKNNLLKIIFAFFVLILKLKAAIFLGIFYAVKDFSTIKLRHLLRFRIFVLKGFLNHPNS